MTDDICKTVNHVRRDLRYIMQGKLDFRPEEVSRLVDQVITRAQTVSAPRKIAVHPPERASRGGPVFNLTVAGGRAVHKLQREPILSLRFVQDGPIVSGRAEISLRKE